MLMLIVTGSLVIILCIFIMFYYDRKMIRDKYKVLKAMWEIIKDHDKRSYILIPQFDVFQGCGLNYKRFNDVINNLCAKQIIDNYADSLCFTKRGVNYYDFDTPPKHIQI